MTHTPFLAAATHTPLIGTIAIGLGAALILGLIAARFRLSPIVGFLIAGIAVGPHTPGFVGDLDLALDLAEIGVILLMFGVGLHFSLQDLLSVKNIALPGALVQVGIATGLGMLLGEILGWSLGAGVLLGLALSVASTVVLLRALEEQRILTTERGRIAMGWLIVEDLLMVLALVLMPVIAGASGDGQGAAADPAGSSVLETLVITLLKVSAFVALMLIVGRRAIPWVLDRISRSGSRELFTLAVLSLSVGIAYASAMIFDVSFALGAFFAGMVLNGSELSHDAAEKSLPFRDAFAVLFFVSVGMLFDPSILVEEPLAVLAVTFIVVLGKSIAAYVIVLMFGYGTGTALTISASLAQVGEFSFILATLGLSLGILPQEGLDLILAGAIVSITLNPFMFKLIAKLEPKLGRIEHMLGSKLREKHAAARKVLDDAAPCDHVVLVGYGGVGRHVVEVLRAAGKQVIVIDNEPSTVVKLEADGVDARYGNAVAAGVLESALVGEAKVLVVAVSDAYEAGEIIRHARAANPDLTIVARAQSENEVKHLMDHGATSTIIGEHEIGTALSRLVAPERAHG